MRASARTAGLAAILWWAIAFSAMAVCGSMTPPPPPPPLFGVSSVTSARISLTSADGDTLSFEADSLSTLTGGTPSEVPGPKAILKFTQSGGTPVFVDSATVGGTYPLADGRTLRLGSKLGYPRYFTLSDAPERCLLFSVNSTARVAVLINPYQGPSLSIQDVQSQLLDRFSAGVRYPSPAQGPAAFEIPVDWYLRGSIVFDKALKDSVRLTWVAYGVHARPSRESAAFHQEGNRVRYVPAMSSPLSLAEAPTPTLLSNSLRIIGEVVVDPVSGHVAKRGGR